MHENIVSRILAKIRIEDIVGEQLDLTKRGKNLWCLCPFHDDQNPSMSVSPDKQIYKCFVCNAGGNVINFLANYQKITFQQAITQLAQKAGFDDIIATHHQQRYDERMQKLIAALTDASHYYQYTLATKAGQGARDYLKTRSIDQDTIEHFQIGYAPPSGIIPFLKAKGHDEATLINASLITDHGKPFFKNRLMFPIANKWGDIVGFSGRKLDQQSSGPKYVNSGGSTVFNKSHIFYNLFRASGAIEQTKQIFITEGFFDVIAMWKSNHPNTLALMGTALTKNHLQILARKTVTLVLDDDEAGQNATLKSLATLMKVKIVALVVRNETKLDLDEIYEQNPRQLSQLLNEKKPALEFIFDYLVKKHQPDDLVTIDKFWQEFRDYLNYGSAFEQDFYINKITKKWAISDATLRQQLRPSTPTSPIQAPKTQPRRNINDTEHFPKVQNTSHRIIMSMTQNVALIDIFEKCQVYFNDAALIEISKYLINMKKQLKNTPLSKQALQTLQTIKNEKLALVETKNEFKDLIKQQNREFKIQKTSHLNVQLRNKTNPQEIAKYLEEIRKAKRNGDN